MIEATTLKSIYTSRKVLWSMVCIGIILRLAQYLFNRSLWLDEVLLALNIIDLSWLELFQPLNYNQGAPIGFLMIQKLCISLFGDSEYTLRLIPLLCGIFSLILFYKIVIKLYPHKPYVRLVSLGFFVLTKQLIYYSTEAKQYSSDVTIALLILYSAIGYIQSKRLTTARIMLFGVSGAITMWFSHPALFVLAGVGISVMLFCMARKEWATVGRLSIIFSLWALSFISLYIVSLHDLSHHKYLLHYWEKGFIPFPVSSLSDIFWFVKMFLDLVASLVGLSASLVGLSQAEISSLSYSELISLPLTSIAVFTYLVILACTTAFFLLIGGVSLFRKSKEMCLLFISPALLTLCASGLGKYPFYGRLILFLFPFLILFLAEGAAFVKQIPQRYLSVTGTILTGLLFLYLLLTAGYYVIKPRVIEEVRPVIRYVGEYFRDGDVLYVNEEAGRALQYYGKRYGLKHIEYRVGEMNIDSIGTLIGHERVWIMFSHIFHFQGPEIDTFLNDLDRRGVRRDAFTTTTGEGRTLRVGIYLYDFSTKAYKILIDPHSQTLRPEKHLTSCLTFDLS